MTLTRPQVRELLVRYDVRPSRARGQNFVVDPNTVRRVARLAQVGPGDRVVEVGAGLGSLTLALAETGASVTAIEVDRRLLPALREVVEPAGVTVVEGDAMHLDWDGLLLGPERPSERETGPERPSERETGPERPSERGWVMVANLPYNIATPLIATVLDEVPALRRLLVMVQREVGERLAAPAGHDAYGAVSVKVAYWATAELVARVPPTVFWPEPKVDSALVDIRRRPSAELIDVDRKWLFALVGTAFGQRRKMLRRSLSGLVAGEAFEAAGVRPETRPEELDVAAWARLATCTRPRPDASELRPS